MQKSEFNLLSKVFMTEESECVNKGIDITLWRLNDLVLVRDYKNKAREKRYRVIDLKTCGAEYGIAFNKNAC